jgi:hypothetical protein
MTEVTKEAPGLGRGGRMSRQRKRTAVLRLLRGEDLELVSRELGVTAATLSTELLETGATIAWPAERLPWRAGPRTGGTSRASSSRPSWASCCLNASCSSAR